MSAHDHGRVSTYTNYGCRCAACRAANAATNAAQRAERRKYPVPASVAHNRNTYVNYGCRCDVCCADRSAYGREYAVRRWVG